MITVVPHDSDWEHIADLTGDESWRAKNMWQYFQRVERCLYQEAPAPGNDDPSGHGYQGWLGTSKVDPGIALGDLDVAGTMIDLFRTCSTCLERIGSGTSPSFAPASLDVRSPLRRFAPRRD